MSSRSPVRMSDSSAEDDQRKAEPTSRKWAEPQPGPSRVEPSRQGYCGYCRVLYRNLDQHLSSLRHLDAVRASSRGSGSASSASGRTKLTLLERFLQDVLQHHPHRYDDPRPSHTDLPSVSAPLLPRAELDERFSDNDSQCRGTQEHLPSSDDASCQPASRLEDDAARSQLGERAGQERLSAPIREQKGGVTDHTHAAHRRALPTQSEDPHSQSQAPPPVHRKAHRKTNRRKTSDSSSSSQPPRGPGPNPRPHLTLTDLRPSLDGCQKPWIAWQRERREAHREEAFSSDHTDPLDRTIEEVIQKCCHGVTSCQDETDSFRLSISVSMETQSEEWDSPVQVVFQRARTLRDTPVQVSQTEGRDLGRLMDTQVDVEDQLYSHQLDSALHGPGDVVEEGFWALPIEEVQPAPERIPESFRGKTWTQIEQEDEEKVERLVRQFRRGRFICYFDTESLARYGRRSQKKKEHAVPEEVEPDAGVLPLMEQNEADSLYVRRRRGRRRGFRLASRCQVVKVSHSTQTVRLVIPAVHQLSPEAQPTGNPEANQEAAERTPDAQTWRSLPSSYSSIITPVQPGTSLVYLLSSPSGPTPTCLPTAGSAQKHCRKKRRPLDQQGLKVKYKRLPVKFYDPTSNRVLKNPPRGFLWRRSSSPSGPPPPCVRQLFRSLSPDLNTDKPPTEVKGHSSNFLLSTLTRDSAQTDTSQAPPLDGRTESRRDVRRERTRPPSSQRRTRAQATPPPPRREALRRAGPGRKLPDSAGHAPLLSSRRGRGRRPRR